MSHAHQKSVAQTSHAPKVAVDTPQGSLDNSFLLELLSGSMGATMGGGCDGVNLEPMKLSEELDLPVDEYIARRHCLDNPQAEQVDVEPEAGPSGYYLEAGGGLASLFGATGGGVGISLSGDGLEFYTTKTTDGWTSEGLGGCIGISAGYYSDKNKFEGVGQTQYAQVETPVADASVGGQRLVTPEGEAYGWGIQAGWGAGLNPIPAEVGVTHGETTFSDNVHLQPGPYESSPEGFIPFNDTCEQADGTWEPCS